MTEPRPEFEEIRLVRLTKPGEGRPAQAAVVVVIALLMVMIARPWDDSRGIPNASPSAVASEAITTPQPEATPRPDGARRYDPSLFGSFTVSPRWELWPTAYVYRFGLSGPLAIDSDGGTAGGSGLPEPPIASPPPGADRIVDIGASDLLVVLGVNTPADTRVLDARLWHFAPGGAPTRVALRELPPPWPVTTFHVYGLRVADDAEPNLVAAWAPGVYRLDLLVDRRAEVRRIGLFVRPAATPGPSPAASGAGSPAPGDGLAGPPVAGFGLDAPIPNAIAFGTLTGVVLQRELASQGRCGLTELWLGEADRPGGSCSALGLDDVGVIAVDLGPDRPIASLQIRELDPLETRIAVLDRASSPSSGRIVRTVDGRPLPEGTYRLVATLADGSELGWYFRILSATG
jgi:hypothetical protein